MTFLCPQLAAQMPARTQCCPWQLVYSIAVHGSSLKTLYRNMAGLDSPVLLVIKDMHNKVAASPLYSLEPNSSMCDMRDKLWFCFLGVWGLFI